MARIQLPSSKSIEQVLRDAFALLKCEPWGGASDNGWSRLKDYLRCPYRFELKHIRKVRATTLSGTSAGIEIGSLGHAVLASYYGGQLPDKRYVGYRPNCPTPDQMLAALEKAGAGVLELHEATQLWEGYIDHWGDDGWTPMAVEMPVGDLQLHTSRYDLVVYVEDGIHDGFWIGEHKCLSSKTDLEQFNLDGEILGECLSWRLSKLDEVFGPLSGVCVNVLLKTRPSSYRRLWLPVDWNRVDEYERDRRLWNREIENRALYNWFPRSLYGCTAGFEKCLYWDHCSTLSDSFLTSKDDQ